MDVVSWWERAISRLPLRQRRASISSFSLPVTLVRVKTTNLGSLNRLTYDVTMRKAGTEKQFIDELRCRNGNLEITVSKQETIVTEL